MELGWDGDEAGGRAPGGGEHPTSAFVLGSLGPRGASGLWGRRSARSGPKACGTRVAGHDTLPTCGFASRERTRGHRGTRTPWLEPCLSSWGPRDRRAWELWGAASKGGKTGSRGLRSKRLRCSVHGPRRWVAFGPCPRSHGGGGHPGWEGERSASSRKLPARRPLPDPLGWFGAAEGAVTTSAEGVLPRPLGSFFGDV